MTKIALLIIYNHRYDKNIPRLEAIYKERFSNIFHIIPFYDGDIKNVIPVYDNSIYFSGYVAQAYTHLKGKGYTHFFVVADDMVLNPVLNENNLFDKMGLKKDECFLDYLHILSDLKFRWYQLRAMKYRIKQRGVEIANVLPSKEYALQQFSKHNIPYAPISIKPYLNFHVEFILNYLLNYKRRLPEYPMVGGYADIFMVTADVMDRFALYCGAFSATKLFVEIAIPTALIIAADKMKLSKDLNFVSGALWTKEDKAFLDKYNNSLELLLADFPKDRLFLHPIKLSQWK